jgi:hypothetical protein
MVASHDTMSAFTVVTEPGQDMIIRLRAVGKNLNGYRAGQANLSDGACRVYKFRRNSFACPRNFEEQNKVLETSIIIINYMIIVTSIINAHYNYNCIINSQNNYDICLTKDSSRNAIRKKSWK